MNNTTNAAKRPSGLRACADGLDTNPDKYFAQKCMRHAADRMEELESSLATVTEQRDRLAEALKDALYDLETSDGLMACDNEEGHSLFCLEQRSIPKARQAIQSLNQPQPTKPEPR